MAENDNIQIQMKKIPVFTVLKNGSILKNIFLLHKQSAINKSSRNQESDEEILLVGRHPHCNITLEHPSISRYHLRIHSNPSSLTLSVVDLSSVHGTCVAGKRIKPGVNVKLKEGDTVKLGSSSRVYELHWVPVSQAYDVDGQLVPAIYTIKEGEEETNQDEKLETHSWDDDLSDMIQDSPMKTLNYPCDNTVVEHCSQSKPENRIIPAIDDSVSLSKSESQSYWSSDNMSDEFELLNHESDRDVLFSVPNCSNSSYDNTVLLQDPLVVSETVFETEIYDKTEDQLNQLKDNLSKESKDNWNNEFELLNHNEIFATFVSETEISDRLNKQKDEVNWLRDNLSNESVQFSDALNIATSMEIDMRKANEEQKIENGVNKDENMAEIKETNVGCDMNYTNMADSVVALNSVETVNKFDHEIMKKESVFVGVPDKTDMNALSPISVKNLSCSVNLYDELEIYTPDKENKDPNARSENSLKKRFKENKTSVFSRKLEKEVNSSRMKSCKSTNHPQNTINQSYNLLGGSKKRWIIIVDTNSLVQAESLKYLKLVQGLKGTQLFIPKFVIRELMDIQNEDNMMTKKVSLALKWIDECMMSTKWWIHINHETTESEVIETAIRLCEQIKDGKIVILSNDLTLKIKAMAQGIMCEEAGEFYKSLVDPFSERFMWVGSWARGLTWSCVDVRNKYGVNESHGLKLVSRVTSFR